MKEVRYCIICKKRLTNNKTKYCSNSCKCKYFYEIHKEYCLERFKKYRKPKVNNKCLNCGKECGRKKYCSDECKPIKISIPRTPEHRKLIECINTQCEICGKTLFTLHVHHISGNHNDNRKGNLISLCPKCHSKIHHLALKEKNLDNEMKKKLDYYRSFLKH